ncbi:(Na+)-NQR maturation NqrM [Moraxella sp. Tifton1]|uniref:(Na+)-NQR maturation NqrM n=1 Tax=Moraxella oculi TaxID=2940516 RepID=A0ABW8U7N3_9GAMM|nr:(Na+)-NQR maturation NqrM [Moraxella sp. Tifton1]MCL1624006.1 (Na+)-NQR maturation NqrM [Moraxella sp. Tifton1]
MSDFVHQFLPIFFVSFGVFVLFFLFMGVGYMIKKQPLKGSCGGVATLMGDEYCQFCGNDPNKCDSLTEEDKKVMLANKTTLDKLAKKA